MYSRRCSANWMAVPSEFCICLLFGFREMAEEAEPIALEILRDNLACRGDDVLDIDVTFEYLEGSGLDVLYCTPRRWDRDVDGLSEEEEGMEYCLWTPEEASEEARGFVLGLSAVNPLR